MLLIKQTCKKLYKVKKQMLHKNSRPMQKIQEKTQEIQ